jgi:hypothetical protein
MSAVGSDEAVQPENTSVQAETAANATTTSSTIANNTNGQVSLSTGLATLEDGTDLEMAVATKTPSVRGNSDEDDDNNRADSPLTPPPADPLWEAARSHPGRISGPASIMMGMTVERGVQLRAGYAVPNLARTANREAVLAQAVGQVEEKPCHHCSKGEGVFATCVRVRKEDELLLKGSCAACHANSTGSRCSLRRK